MPADPSHLALPCVLGTVALVALGKAVTASQSEPNLHALVASGPTSAACGIADALLIGLVCACGVLTWAPVVIDVIDEIKNHPPVDSRRRARQARRAAEAIRPHLGGPSPEIAVHGLSPSATAPPR